MSKERDYVAEGQQAYEGWRRDFLADPENRRVYEEEARKKELWLQLVTQQEVAQRMGVSQAQVARIEKRGYDAYTLRSLRRYLDALGDQFTLEVAVHKGEASGSPVATPC